MKEKFYVNTNSKGNQSWDKTKHFHLFLILVLKSLVFFNVKLIFLKNNVLFISVSGTHFLKQLFADVLKIDALKNCAIL